MPDPRWPRGAFARLGIVCAIGLALLFAAHAEPHAAPAPKCEMPYDEAVNYGRRGVADNPEATFTDYSGDQATRLLAGLNGEPPVSDWTADHILVFDMPEQPVVIGLIDKGCVTKAFKIGRDDWAGVRRAAIGDPS